jgi:transposase
MEAQVTVVAEDVQVVAKPRRRTYTAQYKRRILKEADACTTPGAVGALLRREGLYSSHLVMWRRARGRGELAGLAPKSRGRKATPVDPRDRQIIDRGPSMTSQPVARGCYVKVIRSPHGPAAACATPDPVYAGHALALLRDLVDLSD